MRQRTMSAPTALSERGRAWDVQFKLTNLDGPKLISPAAPVHLSFIRYEPGLCLGAVGASFVSFLIHGDEQQSLVPSVFNWQSAFPLLGLASVRIHFQ
jgi:hypothetical protein